MNPLSFLPTTKPLSARAQQLAEAAVEAGVGHDDEYVLAQFGHAVITHLESLPDRARLMQAVMGELSHSTTASAAALVAAVQQADQKKLSTTSLEELQDLALYQVLRARHKPPAEALADYGMRATNIAKSWEDKARVSMAVLDTIITQGVDAGASSIAAEAKKRCFDQGIARGRPSDASILMQAFPRILQHARAQAAAAAVRQEQEVRRLAEGSGTAKPVQVEEGFVDLGGVRVPRRRDY